MKKTIEILDSTDMRDSYGKERAMRRSKILLAAYEGDEESAFSLLKDLEKNKIRLNSDVLLKKVNGILKN